MTDERLPLVTIMGPTGVGKTDLAISLTKLVSSEIISVDSVQVYKGMDVGTAKPSIHQRQGIPHHLLDLCHPDQPILVGSRHMPASKTACNDQLRKICLRKILYVKYFM